MSIYADFGNCAGFDVETRRPSANKKATAAANFAGSCSENANEARQDFTILRLPADA